jgi:hypothetical protein
MQMLSDEVSPKPKKSIAEILAAKKAGTESIVVEVMPLPPQKDQSFESELSDVVEDFDSKNAPDEDEEPDSFEHLSRLSDPRFFKGEI